ncbi:DUF1905 domain-containing protein [Qipengyuania xiapuensis]|uniref:DUF1905 domain-containing protein n=1 Tax=Qipengyuania xiapuensis TaxID=2867236 RepID=A0ABX8ZV42_9SPHN|nr:DUF1905 domain-containing protein [Qipengyuania xiapuensis]QZD91969.1 DUF1905 domain-containing protein [Qipengyuania xiapuensis]
MSESLACTLPLRRWQGDRGTYHLVTITGEAAEAIAAHALMHRLEFGTQRGFGSVKVMASVGRTNWKTSVFPQREKSEWVLLVSKKVMRAEDLAEGDPVELELELL